MGAIVHSLSGAIDRMSWTDLKDKLEACKREYVFCILYYHGRIKRKLKIGNALELVVELATSNLRWMNFWKMLIGTFKRPLSVMNEHAEKLNGILKAIIHSDIQQHP